MTAEEAIRKSKEIKQNKVQEIKDSCTGKIKSLIKEIEEKVIVAVEVGSDRVEIFRFKSKMIESRFESFNKQDYIINEVLNHFISIGCQKNTGITDVLSYIPTEIIYLEW